MAEAPGFYGKAPALGDFVSRRVPGGFASAWHDFLAGVVAGSRQRLGAEWLGWWNEAPVWHFVLGAGIAGPAVWCGVLIPSVDRVGRHFPFTVLGAIDAAGTPQADWALAAEALTLSALEDGFTADGLAEGLDRLGACAGPTDTPAMGDSLWSCRDAPRLPATLRRWHGLPPPEQAARLVADTGATGR